MSSRLHALANPAAFARFSQRIVWPMLMLGVATLGYGLYLALLASPPDYQQGETVRIMYIHVPSAWLSMGIYAMMAVCSAIWLVWRHPLADLLARNAAPLGAIFTAIVLITGSLWGKPMWGAWWVWDARLTSVLILFFLYLGYMALADEDLIDNRSRSRVAIFSLVGAVNLPIIKFSVNWWNTLHQPASVLRSGGSSLDASMLKPLLVVFLGLSCLFAVCLIWRVQAAMAHQKWRRQQLQKMNP